MLSLLRIGAAIIAISTLSACGRMEQSSRARAGDGAVIYQSTILTMDSGRPSAEAVIVKDGVVIDLGAIDDLVQAYPGASFDERFLRRILLPAFIDVRLEPNALNVVEVPCQGGLLPEEIASLSPESEQVRVIAGGPAALAAAIDAVRRIPEEAARKRVTVEVRGPVDANAARMLTSLSVPLVLSGDPVAPGCEPPAIETAPAQSVIAGRIAVAPSTGDQSLLGAASQYLRGDGPIRLSARDALEAITIDAARALGAEAERGVIAGGRRADFAVLDRNPLATTGETWASISVEIADLSAAAAAD